MCSTQSRALCIDNNEAILVVRMSLRHAVSHASTNDQAACAMFAAAGTPQAPGINRRAPAQPGAAGVHNVRAGAGRQLVPHPTHLSVGSPIKVQVGSRVLGLACVAASRTTA